MDHYRLFRMISKIGKIRNAYQVIMISKLIILELKIKHTMNIQ